MVLRKILTCIHGRRRQSMIQIKMQRNKSSCMYPQTMCAHMPTQPFFTSPFLKGLSGVAPLCPSVRSTNASEFAKNGNSRGPGDLRARCKRLGPSKNFQKFFEIFETKICIGSAPKSRFEDSISGILVRRLKKVSMRTHLRMCVHMDTFFDRRTFP